MPVLFNIGLLATCRDEGGQEAIHTIPEAALAWRAARSAGTQGADTQSADTQGAGTQSEK